MITTLLANSTVDVRGGIEQFSQQPVQMSLTPIIADLINGAVLIGALLFLVYLILGAIGWVTAGGDKGKIEAARNKIVQGFIGLAVLVFAYTIYLFAIDYLGINLGQGGGGSAMVGGGAGAGAGGGAAGGVCTPNQRGTFGGSTGYCKTGAAQMQCFGPGQGVSGFDYNHWEPCECLNGPADRKPGYNFDSC